MALISGGANTPRYGQDYWVGTASAYNTSPTSRTSVLSSRDIADANRFATARDVTSSTTIQRALQGLRAPAGDSGSGSTSGGGSRSISIPGVSVPGYSVPSIRVPMQVRAGSVTAPGIDWSFKGDYERALNMYRQEAASLEANYRRDKAELREQFQFAETEQERAAIAKQVADLERRRDDGLKAIEAGYAATQAEVRQRGEQAGVATDEEAAAVQGRYVDAAAETANAMRAVDQGPEGLGVAAVPVDTGEIGAYMAAVGAAESENTRRMGEITEEDIAWLADTLGGESQAQQAGLTGLAMQLISAREAEHAQRVADRIQQERMVYAQQVAALQESFRQRGYQLTDNQASTLLQLAEATRASQEAYASRRLQAGTTNAQLAFQASQANASNAMQAQSLQLQAANAAASNSLARAELAFRQNQANAELALRQRELDARSGGGLTPQEQALQQLAVRGQLADFSRMYGVDVVPQSLRNLIPTSISSMENSDAARAARSQAASTSRWNAMAARYGY